jgi:hypothetical protein
MFKDPVPYRTPNIFRLHYKTGKVSIKVTLRSVHVTNVAVKKNNYIFSVYVCSLEYPACNAYATYYIVCGLSGCTIFFHIIPHKRCDFPEKL